MTARMYARSTTANKFASNEGSNDGRHFRNVALSNEPLKFKSEFTRKLHINNVCGKGFPECHEIYISPVIPGGTRIPLEPVIDP